MRDRAPTIDPDPSSTYRRASFIMPRRVVCRVSVAW